LAQNNTTSPKLLRVALKNIVAYYFCCLEFLLVKNKSNPKISRGASLALGSPGETENFYKSALIPQNNKTRNNCAHSLLNMQQQQPRGAGFRGGFKGVQRGP